MDVPLQWQAYGIALGIFVGIIVVGEIVVWALTKYAKPRAEQTKSTLDERLITAAFTPIRFAAFIFALQFGLYYVNPNGLWLGFSWAFWFGTLGVVWAANFLSNFINAFLAWYYYELSEAAKRKHIGLSDDVIPILRRVVKIVVYTVALVMVLGRFGVDVGPIVGALGLGGLAVALALQNTLGNFFAGVYLLSEKPVRQGDYIAVTNDQTTVTGQVLEVGWGNTRLLTDENFEYYIPNQVITQSFVLNYSRGEAGEWKAASVTIGVAREYNVDEVEALLRESLAKVEEKDKRFIAGKNSNVEFAGASGANFSYRVSFAVTDYTKRGEAHGALLKQILKDLRAAGVVGA